MKYTQKNMQAIAKTPLYTLSVDTQKNRLYSSKIGFWHDSSHIDQFIRDIKTAIRGLSEGFTMLSDLTQLQFMSHAWSEIVLETQRMLIEAGCCGKAEISPEKVVAKIQMDRISNRSGIKKREFRSKDEAETWLDRINMSEEKNPGL